jgi:hypothetical protein
MKTVVEMALCVAVFACSIKAQSPSTLFNSGVTSEHFIAYTPRQGGPSSADVLELCEQLRSELCRVWCVGGGDHKWTPLCEIVVHPTLESYLLAVGPAAAQTRGCSLIELARGQVSRRRIDLRIDSDGSLSALAHELTHVVLADRFHGKPPAHWLDEGIATLADTREKQMLHERDCQEAVMSGRALSMHTLLHLEQFTSPDQMPAFYGQSLSLVNMLARQSTPEQLIDFAVDARDRGYALALKKHYGIQSVAELEIKWRVYAANARHAAPNSPVLISSLRP